MSLIYCLITEPAYRRPTPAPDSDFGDVENTRATCLRYTLIELVMQKTGGRGGLRSGVRYYVFRYAASGTTSDARWKFDANRSSFKGGTDKRTLQLYIREV